MRCSRLVRSAAILALVLPCAAQPAHADSVVINIEFTARHTFGDLQQLFGVPISAGDVFGGRLVYELGAPDVDPTPTGGSYHPTGSLIFDVGTGLTLPVESVFAFDETFNVDGRDDVFGAFAFASSYPGFDSLLTELDFRGAGRVGDALPASNDEALAFFTGGGFRFVGFETGGNPPFDSGTHELFGTARIVPGAPEPVPEPGTLLLVATALGGITLGSRRRSRSSGPTPASRRPGRSAASCRC